VPDQPSTDKAASKRPPLVRVEDLGKRFEHGGRELEVLKNVNLELHEGDMVSVVGRSGVGKSTLLHVLGTIDLPTCGTIYFNGVDLSRLSGGQLAEFRNRSIGFVFQFHHLLPEFTALENVMMPALIQRISTSKARQLALELLEAVDLGSRLTHRPSELSGGEQQRVALARAVVMQPKLLLADEPTGNLDTKTGDAILDLFFKINEQFRTTMLIVTHNPELAGKMTRSLRMVDGRVEEVTVGHPYRDPKSEEPHEGAVTGSDEAAS
jgi:lipoprotein-releasing system ATP-binding protein